MSDSSNDSTQASVERLRERVIDRLTTGYSEDLLSEGEFEDRLRDANHAETHAELRQLIADLPADSTTDTPATTGSRAARRRDGEALDDLVSINYGTVEQDQSVVAVFSGADRKGVWSPPRNLNVLTVFGGSDIELHEANLPPEGLTIQAFAFFGGVDITVPEEVNVRIGGAGIFGAFDAKKRRREPIPGAPTITVNGAAIFGAVEVKYK